VRDGDPAALAGLCDRRGPAVLAYCQHVAGDAAAAAAAAEAFAHFRSAVVAADDMARLDPEALLVNATRHAAAHHAGIVATGVCAEVPALLAARAEHAISVADLERLDEHLATCWTCRAPVERFKAAERAYRDPPDASVPPEAATVIVAALAAAAPVRKVVEEAPAVKPVTRTAAAKNGTGDHAPPGRAADAAAPASVLDAPTTAHRTVDDLDSRPGRSSRNGDRDQRRSARRGTVDPRLSGGTQLPRTRRAPSSPGAARRGRGGALRPSIALPLVLVTSALVIALFVAGVFGADDPASNPASVTPADTPPATTKAPEIVVVPGAADASASEVERVKARARSEHRREAKSDRTGGASAAPPPPPPPPPPAASAAPTPAPAVDRPAPRRPANPTPPAQRDTGGTGSKRRVDANKGTTGTTGTGSKRRIDANKGATGAEQLPPAKNTSTVEELAPPVEPAPPPG
jgi:hypothetical protein